MSMQSDHEFAPTQIAAVEFPTVAFRGYDQDAVRRYLTRLASVLEEKGGDALAALSRTTTLDRIEELEEENDSLRSEVRDLELELVQRSVDGPPKSRGKSDFDDDDDQQLAFDEVDSEFDEHRAIELLGKETARVLESARSAAAELVKKAERQAKTVEKDARSELSEARRESRRLMAEKQAEAEGLVKKVATEAEEAADRLRTEAEQHREMVLAESKKIMGDAEAQAEADEKWAQHRAEQIVADAEALRQQLLSELVVERTRVRTDLEEVASARDRLVMALVVARSELDDMSQQLDTLAGPSAEKPATSDSAAEIDLNEAEAQSQVEDLVSELDEKLPAIDDGPSERSKGKAGATSKNSGRTNKGSSRRNSSNKRGSKTEAGAGQVEPDADELIDLAGDDSSDNTDESGRSGKRQSGSQTSSESPGRPSGGQSSGKTSGRNGSNRKSGKSRRKNGRRGSAPVADADTAAEAPAAGSAAAGSAAAGSATALAEPPANEKSDPDVDMMDLVDAPEAVDASSDTAAQVDDETELDEIELDAADLEDVDEDSGLSLIEGFNTIELTESELGLSSSGGEIVDDDDGLDQVITTVVSREHGEHTEGNRGDLLIDEEYRGRLPSAIAARDDALARADEFHRSIRRALNDDQSEVLDRLRGGRGAIEVSELHRFSDQIERYLKPLRDGLAPVALAGAKAGGRREISAGVLDNLARQLAKYIVDKVRIPVIREIEHATDHDREKLFEPIRSIYRDFRNTGLLDLADDALFESFAIGLYGAIPAETAVIWLLDPRHDPDPVCEINAGRSGVVKGQKFPSGHVRPLALPNCRCLVVPD